MALSPHFFSVCASIYFLQSLRSVFQRHNRVSIRIQNDSFVDFAAMLRVRSTDFPFLQ